MARDVTHRYVDPLAQVWLAAARRIGLRVVRTPEAYAATEDPLAKAVIAHMLTRIVVFTESPREAATLARRVREELPAELVDARQALEAFELSVVLFGEESHRF